MSQTARRKNADLGTAALDPVVIDAAADPASDKMRALERRMVRREAAISERDRVAHTGSSKWLEDFAGRHGRLVPTKRA